MITDASQGWVLYKTWQGDTSARVTFFTDNQGIVTAIYKGGRTPKKQSLLQAFTPVWLSLNRRGDACFIRQIEPLSPSLPLGGHALFSGLYINELLYHLLRPYDSCPSLFNAYVSALRALSISNERLAIEAILRRFEKILLKEWGYFCSLTEDVEGLPIVSTQTYSLLCGEGFAKAESGILGAHLLAFASDDFNDLEVLKAAKGIMRKALDYALEGKPVKARELYNIKYKDNLLTQQ